jgi:diadenosine tetraphosphate (Ap4A) HIT family hydrolase
MTSMDVCRLCTLPTEDKQSVDVLVTESWHAYAPWDITPGAFLVQTRRHVEGPWSLDRTECQSLGPVLRDLSVAVQNIYSAEKVYIAALGEAHPHFHFILLPRVAAVPPPERGLAHLAGYLTGDGNGVRDRPLVRRVAALLRSGNGGPATAPANRLRGQAAKS